MKEPTRLGEAFEPDGSIDSAGVDRVVASVVALLHAAQRLSVEQLFAFATSAVRDATNREDIVARIEHEAGLRSQFLTGEDEARLTYLAMHRWYGWSAGRLLGLDIGGGSMELMLGRDAEPEVAVSLPLGAGRLTRAFLPDDPPTRRQLKELRRHVRDTLREVADRLRWEGHPSKAVATSKTFKQLARVAGAPAQRKGPFAQRTLTLKDLSYWTTKLSRMTATERAELRGVARPRSRQILAGAVVAKATMQALDIDKVDICPWALREGIMLRYLQSSLDESTSLPLQPVSPKEAGPANVHALSGRSRSQAG